MAVVVDDVLLLRVLSETAPAWLAAEVQDSTVYTTSCWYYRLGRAVLAPAGDGSLSRQAATLPAGTHARLLASLRQLPDHVGLASSRITVPVMAELRVTRTPNMLAAEALAVATLTGGRLIVTAPSPVLAAGAAELGIPFEVVS